MRCEVFFIIRTVFRFIPHVPSSNCYPFAEKLFSLRGKKFFLLLITNYL